MLDWLRRQAISTGAHGDADAAARSATHPSTPPGVHAGHAALSDQQFRLRIAATARWLADAGLGDGDVVALLAHNSLLHLLLQFAAPQIGACFAPLNTRLAAAEQLPLLKALNPALLIAQPDLVGRVPASYETITVQTATDGIDRHATRLAAAGDTRIEAACDLECEPGHIGLLLQTGGSTGTPKLAQIPLRQIAANARDTVRQWNLSSRDCAIQATPMFHAAVNVLTTPLLACGGSVVIAEQFEPGAFLRAVSQHRVTVLFLVPTMYRMLAEHPDFAAADLSSVRFAVSGGAPCDAALRARFAAKGVAFRQGYGLTEGGVNCFWIDDQAAAANPDAVGWPMPGLDAVVRDLDGTPCQPNEPGELTLRGQAVFAGYLGNSDATAQTLKDGWLWTGDIAQYDAVGIFRIVGRRKEMFISGGENVYPPEIEAALHALPAVAEAAVIGVPDQQWGEVGVAAIVLRTPSAPDAPERLRAALEAQLARYKLPKYIQIMDALPRTGAGKIDKPAIRRGFLAANTPGAPVFINTVLSEETDAPSNNQPTASAGARHAV